MRKIRIANKNKHSVISFFLDGENINLVEICKQKPYHVTVSNEQYLLACKHGFVRFIRDKSVEVDDIADKIKPQSNSVTVVVKAPEVNTELSNDTLVIKETKKSSKSRKK